MYPSKSREYIFIGSQSTLSTEFRYLSSDTPNNEFRIIQKRERGLEYQPYHIDDMFYITTNHNNSTNFKIIKTAISNPSKSNWIDIIPHRDNVLVDDLELFTNFMVIEERENGLINIRVKSYDGKQDYYLNQNSNLNFQNDTYSASLGYNPEFNTDEIRINYSSLTIPSTVLNYNVQNKEEEILKQQEVLGGNFDSNNYVSERVFAKGHDGK